MTRATARSSLRSPGVAMRASVPKEARADAPKPTPATTVPTAARATTWPSTPPRVNPVPPESRVAAIAKTLLVGHVLSRKAVRAPAPHSSDTTRPPIRWFFKPKRPAATEGPSERYRPPSAQLATMIGSSAKTSGRRRAGMPSMGVSEAMAPERRPEVSGVRAMATPAKTIPTNSTAKTRCVGAGAYWTSAPHPNAPIASPLIGATPLTRPARPGECGGFRSTSVAPSVENAMPVAMPCATRATRRTVTPPATKNSTKAAEYRAATDVIGKTAENQKRPDQAEDIDGEDEGQRGSWETPLLLVDDVQRGRRTRRRREDHENGCDRSKGDRARKAAGAAFPRQSGFVLDGCRFDDYFPASTRRASATMSAPVFAWPLMPQPPSGDSVISTQVRSVNFGSPAAAATISVSSRTTPSCLSRSRTPIGVRTCTRT